MLKDWSKFEKCFLFLGTFVTCIATYFFKGTWIDFTYTMLYFITALLLAKGKYSCYIICFISTFFYAYISYINGYYGEIIVSLGLTLPLSIYGLVNWLKNLYNKHTVRIRNMSKRELMILIGSQFIMVFGYYLLLKVFNTNNLIVSTLSLVASVMASYCTARRSENGFIFYIINDLILITLWGLPVITGNLSLIPVLLCPMLLLVNDIYGVYNWKRLKEKQGEKNE